MDPNQVLRLVESPTHRRRPIRGTRGALSTIVRVRARMRRDDGPAA
jgi:hypothetical protein